MAKFDDFYDNLEHKTAISDIYDKLNKQTKDDLEHHPEKEYLEKLLQDFCYIVDVYNNYEAHGDSDIHHFSSKLNVPKIYQDMTLSIVALNHREYKKSYELASYKNWKNALAASTGYAIIKEYERILFDYD